MLLPATLLGRQGIAPVALARDLPLQGPASALQGFAQELQFRGLLLGALDRVAPPWAANLGQAAFFGLAHIAVQYQGPADAFVPVTVALGWLFGWITQKTGSLWPAIIIHAIAGHSEPVFCVLQPNNHPSATVTGTNASAGPWYCTAMCASPKKAAWPRLAAHGGATRSSAPRSSPRNCNSCANPWSASAGPWSGRSRASATGAMPWRPSSVAGSS